MTDEQHVGLSCADVPEEDVRLTAALDETAQWLHHVLHNWPGAAERFEACPVLPCCRNCEVLGRPYSGRVQDAALLAHVPVLMPTLTDEEHAAVERTLTRTQEARQARKRDEAYRAMVEALTTAQSHIARFTAPSVYDAIDAALALARQVEE